MVACYQLSFWWPYGGKPTEVCHKNLTLVLLRRSSFAIGGHSVHAQAQATHAANQLGNAAGIIPTRVICILFLYVGVVVNSLVFAYAYTQFLVALLEPEPKLMAVTKVFRAAGC